jgi:pyruvate ferredoxin oxidoreductase gamma subunit
VVSFCRIDDRPIRTREPIFAPEAVLVVDPTLVHQVDLFAGLKPNGYLMINSTRDLGSLGLAELGERLRADRVRTVPATELARQYLGRPLPNAALLGAFAGLTGLVSIASLTAAIRKRFAQTVADGNVAAADAAYRATRGGARLLEPSHA